MKRCPQCNRTYADDTLSFCLEDGGVLSAPYDEEETVAFSKEQPPGQTDPNFRSDKSVATVIAKSPHTSPPQVMETSRTGGSLNPHLIYAVAGMIAVFGVAGIAFLFTRNANDNAARQTNQPINSARTVANTNAPKPIALTKFVQPTETSKPNCVVSYTAGSCWTVQPSTLRPCSRLSTPNPSASVSSDGSSATLVVPANMAQGVKAQDESGNSFTLRDGEWFEIVADGQTSFSGDHPCASPEGVTEWYDPFVDSPFVRNVGGLEFSIGSLQTNRFFASNYYRNRAEVGGVPVFRLIDRSSGYSGSGAFNVTIRKIDEYSQLNTPPAKRSTTPAPNTGKNNVPTTRQLQDELLREAKRIEDAANR